MKKKMLKKMVATMLASTIIVSSGFGMNVNAAEQSSRQGTITLKATLEKSKVKGTSECYAVSGKMINKVTVISYNKDGNIITSGSKEANSVSVVKEISGGTVSKALVKGQFISPTGVVHSSYSCTFNR